MIRLFQIILLVLPIALAGSSLTSCKVFPGTPDWPPKPVWDSLDKALEGRLSHPDPPAAACHADWPEHDAAACQEIKTNWTAYEFHCENPVSVILDQYTNYTCLPDEDDPCSDAGYPAYVVNATTPGHVKLAVDFARKHNVRLVVKNTGHDYMGRSIAPGALSIWTHHLKTLVHHDGSFKLDGCDVTIPGNAITAGAGVQMYDAYSFADRFNETIVGGGGKSVGLGGYITGGGHSVLAVRYGLAADQVLQMELVTPKGDVLTVNEKQHADLFWAMRGGGGSTFGVLTSITMKSHPTPKILAAEWMVIISPDSPHFFDVLAYTLSQFPSLANAGFSGYSFITTGIPNPQPGPGIPDVLAGILNQFIVQDRDDVEAVNALLAPLNQTLHSRWPGEVQFVLGTKPYDSFLEWFDEHYDTDPAGGSGYLVSRLLDQEALEGDQVKLSAAIKSARSTFEGAVTLVVLGKGVHDALPRGGSDSVNPGWRKAYAHAIGTHTFQPFNETSRKQAMDSLQVDWEPFRKLAPDTGSYINEASCHLR